MKNIVIINQPTDNRGDEAAHKSLVRQLNLKYPDTNITVIFMHEDPNSIEQMRVKSLNNLYVNITNFKKGTGKFLPRLFMKYTYLLPLAYFHPAYCRYVKIIKKADFVICAPGGINMGGFQSWQHIFYLKLALKYHHVLYYGRSIGPFPEETSDNRIFKKRSLDLLLKLDSISLRDAKSMQIAEEFRVPYIPSIDTAFLDVPLAIVPDELVTALDGNYIVFVPNSLTWHPAYKLAKQEIIDDLYLSIISKLLVIKRDCKIVMLPQLFNDFKKPDEKYFQKLKDKIGDERIIVLPETYDSDIQQAIIAQSKIVIGARYHSIVFAINNEIPFIALSYEHKMDGLLDLLKIDQFSINISKIGNDLSDNHKIIQQIEYLLEIEQPSLSTVRQQANRIARQCFKTTFDN